MGSLLLLTTPSIVKFVVSKGADSVRPGWSGVEHGCKGLESQLGSLQKDLLWTDSKDVWSMRLDPVWAEFHGTPSAGSRLVVLVHSPSCESQFHYTKELIRSSQKMLTSH